MWGAAAPNHPGAPLNDWQANRQSDDDNANLPQQPAVEVSEEQVISHLLKGWVYNCLISNV